MTPEGAAAPASKPTPRRDADQGRLCARTAGAAGSRAGRPRSITDLAEQEGVTDAYVRRLLPLTCLAPDIVEAIFDGRQPKGLRLAELLGNGPLAWNKQRSVGLPARALRRRPAWKASSTASGRLANSSGW